MQIIFIDSVALQSKEIMHLVVSVRLSVCPSSQSQLKKKDDYSHKYPA